MTDPPGKAAPERPPAGATSEPFVPNDELSVAATPLAPDPSPAGAPVQVPVPLPPSATGAPVQAPVSLLPPSPVWTPPPATFWTRLRHLFARARDYFTEYDPAFWSALAPLVALSMILFTRFPSPSYIFDEQEALLANPYVRKAGDLRFVDAVHRDFWGLPADRSVGSYRPLPNFLWRSLWHVSEQPFFHHFYNVLFHAINGAILVWVVFRMTRRRGLAYLSGFIFVACAVLTEAVTGIVGIADVLGGMGALLALAALFLPGWAMPFGVAAGILFGLFSKESALVCVPLVPLFALAAAPLTHPERPSRALRFLAALLAAAGAFVLYVELRKRWFPSPTPAELTAELPEGASRTQRLMRELLLWFHQAPLPKDPINNPLAEADFPHRVAGALRVYFRGLVQLVFPKTLSGDYSYPQEPIPEKLIFPESVAGAALMGLPFIGAAALWIRALLCERRARHPLPRPLSGQSYRTAAQPEPLAPDGGLPRPSYWLLISGLLIVVIALAVGLTDVLWRHHLLVQRFPRHLQWVFAREYPVPLYIPAALALLAGLGMLAEARRPLPRPDPAGAPVPINRSATVLSAIGLVWIVVSYFPHSNIPVVLPTVRADRFWYFPAIGSSLLLAALFAWLYDRMRDRRRHAVVVLFGAFFAFQCVQAYRHAMDYRSDLHFWEGTKNAVPNSAKAHLNFSVMKGAKGDLQARLQASYRALELAPKWPMAHIYTGDTLCRLHKADEAWPHYTKGFDLGPGEPNLIALALQCLYDEGQLTPHEDELRELADKHPSSWLAFLVDDTLKNGEKNKGVDPTYRPRNYNEGPKDN